MFKLILLAVVLYGVYFIFFRKPTSSEKSIENEDAQTVVECKKCGVYISAKEVLQRDGENYCSDECMRLT